MNSDPMNMFLSLPVLLHFSAPVALCPGERTRSKVHKRKQLARWQPFCYSLSAHAPPCKWGRDRMERGRVRGSVEMPIFVCVCVCVIDAERVQKKTSSYSVKAKAVSCHMGLNTSRHHDMQAGCLFCISTTNYEKHLGWKNIREII